MLSVEEALAMVMAVELRMPSEEVALWDAHGRVLAEHVASATDLPPWSNSAMDGYAVVASDTSSVGAATQEDTCGPDAPRAADVGVRLRVLETIAAGSVGTQTVRPGTCSRIMTGAPLPDGADAVVMREDVVDHGDGTVEIRRAAREGQHIRRAGEELEAGDIVLEPGVELHAGQLGVAAACGRASLEVARRPRVAIVATGDELQALGEPLGPGQIWSSNTTALASLVRAAGGIPIDAGVAPDDLEGTRATFRRALDAAPDLLISTGGVSVGDFDVVKQAMADEGAEMRFWKVRVKPGKPLAFGVIGGVPTFGLPGNPVSCLVEFLQFVRPVIRRALGDPDPFLPVEQAVLTEPLRKKAGRAELVRVRLARVDGQLQATVTGSQSSGQITSMAWGHGFAMLAPESTGAPAGTRVCVQIFSRAFEQRDDPGYRWCL